MKQKITNIIIALLVVIGSFYYHYYNCGLDNSCSTIGIIIFPVIIPSSLLLAHLLLKTNLIKTIKNEILKIIIVTISSIYLPKIIFSFFTQDDTFYNLLEKLVHFSDKHNISIFNIVFYILIIFIFYPSVKSIYKKYLKNKD